MDIYEKRLTILKALIGENSLKDFSNVHDVDASYLSQLLNGHRTLGDRAAINLESKLGIPAGVLVSGDYSSEQRDEIFMSWNQLGLKRSNLPHPAFFNSKITDTAQRAEQDRKDYEERLKQGIPVPVVGQVEMDGDGSFEAGEYPAGLWIGFIDVHSSDENAYSLQIVGSGMHPRLKNGEYLLIEPAHAYLPGDEVVVTTKDKRAMIKEFIYSRNGQIRLDNVIDGSGPVFLNESEIESVHYVAGILKPSKILNCD